LKNVVSLWTHSTGSEWPSGKPASQQSNWHVEALGDPVPLLCNLLARVHVVPCTVVTKHHEERFAAIRRTIIATLSSASRQALILLVVIEEMSISSAHGRSLVGQECSRLSQQKNEYRGALVELCPGIYHERTKGDAGDSVGNIVHANIK
jgi:hypothetical protein